jgi:GlcNAc-P-P-Und epimerase
VKTITSNKEKILITGASGFIGTNLIDLLTNEGYSFINFDKAKPCKECHESFWHQGNLLKKDDIKKVLNSLKPDVIIHLAARTDTLSDRMEDYIDNTQGTENLIRCLEDVNFTGRVIITSTQYVYKSEEKPLPTHDDEYVPYTAYGQSKVITEQLTRESDLQCCWTIVRPVNIWGPWHLRYPVELWRIIDKGFYIHPSNNEVIRAYGYVKNVAYQLLQIVEAEICRVDKQTYYLGDAPIDSYDWLNTISNSLSGKDIQRIPSFFFILPAFFGDFLMKLGVSSPLYTKRLNNMIEDYPAPTDRTVSAFRVSHPSLQDNVKETIEWINTDGRDLFDYWKNRSL